MIARCLERAEIDNIYPIFYMPDLPRWGRDRCVLVWDAAHAMTPATGQGLWFGFTYLWCKVLTNLQYVPTLLE